MTTTHPRPAVDQVRGLGPTRAKVLGTLQDLRAPATAADVAGRLGIHPNTARFHLDALVASGLAERAREDRRRPGRPQVHYAPTQSAPQAGHRSYRLLAEILTRHLVRHSGHPHADGIQAGEEFGRYLAASSGLPGPHDAHPLGPQEAVTAVVETLDGLGFESGPLDPDGLVTSRATSVEVTNCPFLEVAEGHLEVVCAVHRGIMDGMLAELGAPAVVERLDPLVAPTRCVARFTSPRGRRGSTAAGRVARQGTVPR